MLAASTDAIRGVAFGLSSASSNPRLFRVDRGDFGSKQHVNEMVNSPEKVLGHEIASAEEVWKSVLDFVSYYQIDGKDVVIEGVAVLPAEVRKVDFEYKAVFIANLNDPTEYILQHAQDNPHDWTNKYDESTIRAYGKFNQKWNQYYAEEAERHGLPVVTVDPDNFTHSIDEAVNILLNS